MWTDSKISRGVFLCVYLFCELADPLKNSWFCPRNFHEFSAKMIGYEKFDNDETAGSDQHISNAEINPPPKSPEENHTEIKFTETKPVPVPQQNNVKVADFDHIEVSLEDEVKDEIPLDVIGRANDFFLEYNDNYRLSWQEVAAELDKDLEVNIDYRCWFVGEFLWLIDKFNLHLNLLNDGIKGNLLLEAWR